MFCSFVSIGIVVGFYLSWGKNDNDAHNYNGIHTFLVSKNTSAHVLRFHKKEIHTFQQTYQSRPILHLEHSLKKKNSKVKFLLITINKRRISINAGQRFETLLRSFSGISS